MGDLISRQAAIDAVMEFMPSLTTPDGCGQFDREIFEAQEMFVDIGQALNELPSAQPEPCEDTISRQAVIEINRSYHGQMPNEVNHRIWKEINELPSAQPETHEEHTETHACDYINRKDAIDAHYEYCNKHPDAGFPVWSLKILEDLPSAQPERRWIPCSERLPKEDVEVLISYRYKEGEGDTSHTYIDITTYGQMYFGGNKVGNYKHWRAPFEYFESNYEVIAWMPLPEPYAERRTDE